MIRTLGSAIVLLFSVFIYNYNLNAQEDTEYNFPISNIEEIITRSGVSIDNDMTSDGNGALFVDATSPVTVELFELDHENFKNKRLTFKAQMRSEDLKSTEDTRGISYIELIAAFPDGEELMSRGPRVPVSGTTDWRLADTVLYLDSGHSPDSVKLNLVVEGQGKVWLDDINLEAIPLRLNYLFWGHIVVWIVLIIYIYDLIRKNRQLKRELEVYA